jgi:DNA-binding transcriptional LysR family regulator
MVIDLYRINLNLLIALDVLLAEQNVTQAAKKLFLSQAAMSKNLQQLRDIFKDELLVREKNRMILTNYASLLQPKLHQVLEEIRNLIENGQRFEPSTSQRSFKIGMSDYMSSLLLPKVLEHLQRKAPGIEIIVMPVEYLGDPEAFEKGKYDLALGKIFGDSPSIKKQLLFKDRGVCVLSKKHPLAKKQNISLEEYLNYPHTAVLRTDNPERPRIIDEALAKLNVKRQVRISLPYMGPIFQLIEASDSLIGTAPQKIALLHQKHYSILIKPLPFDLQEMKFQIAWHHIHESDLGHTWLRNQIMEIADTALLAK